MKEFDFIKTNKFTYCFYNFIGMMEGRPKKRGISLSHHHERAHSESVKITVPLESGGVRFDTNGSRVSHVQSTYSTGRHSSAPKPPIIFTYQGKNPHKVEGTAEMVTSPHSKLTDILGP